MAESAPEYTADFLLEFLPDLLPKPIDSAAKAAVKTFKDQLDTLLAQPRLKRELLEAAQQAELNFRMEAQRHMKSDKLVQAVASLPLFDREMFQKSLASLPDHLNEDYLAKDLQDCIADDWKGEFSPDELREGVAVYLNCLRVQLLKVSGFAEVIARLVTLRIDTRTATIQAGVEELLRRTERRPWKGVKIQVVVEGNLSGFTISKRDELIGILAALLRIEKDQIRILRVSSGSVVIELQLPEDAASELYELHRNRDSRLANLGILSIVLPGEEFAQNLVTTLFTIPAPVQDFTGREAELEKLKAEFTRGAVITGVSGGGGIGKTELARKLAYEIADDYPDARMSIDLLGTSEKPMLSEEVMRRLLEPFYPDQKLPDDETQLKGLYQQTFATKKTLLLLDNASNAAQVRPLIPPAPSAAIITSRQHFSLTEFGLKEPLRLDVLSFEQSRELLRSASSKFNKLSDDDIDKLTVLCGRLPLALRVAASLLNDRSDWKPDDLLKQLRDEHTRLERLKREDDQDFDVEATLSLSYKLLNEDLKKYFRMLAVFTAPFPALSAQAIWNIENEGNADDMLGKLVNRNLLDFLPAQEGKGGLYVLHDLTRLYATRRLLEHKAEAEEVVSRHAAHFLEWASDANNEYKVGGEHIVLALEQFRFIWPELLLAWERLLPDQRIWPRPQSADVWLSEFPSLCGYLLDLSIPPRSLTPFLNTGLDAARRISNKEAEGILLSNLGLITERLGDSRSAVGHFEQALIILRESGNLLSEGATLNNLGAAYLSLGEFNKAIEFYKQSLIIDRKIGNRRGEGAVLGNLGVASKNLGRLQDAIEYYEQALAIAREIGDRRNEGGWLGSLGLVYTLLGDAKKAVGFHEEQILIAREIGDQYSLSNGLGNLGFAQLNLGNFDMAIKCYEQALEIDRMRGDRHGEGEDIGYLGSAYADLEDLPHALEYFEQALATAREIGDRQNESNWLDHLGNIYIRMGDLQKAIEHQERARKISIEIGDRRGEGISLGNLGIAYASFGESAKAIELYEQALMIARETTDRRHEGIWLGNLGTAYLGLGKLDDALNYYEIQIQIMREISDHPNEGVALLNLGTVYQALGDIDKAFACLEQALLIFDELKSPHAKIVREQLSRLDTIHLQKMAGLVQSRGFIEKAIRAGLTKSQDARKYLNLVLGILRYPNASAEDREIAKVLQEILMGIKNPDLSGLPKELAALVREELEK